MFKVDHIAIAVKNLPESRKRIEDLFGAKFIVESVNEKGQYRVAIFRVGRISSPPSPPIPKASWPSTSSITGRPCSTWGLKLKTWRNLSSISTPKA